MCSMSGLQSHILLQLQCGTRALRSSASVRCSTFALRDKYVMLWDGGLLYLKVGLTRDMVMWCEKCMYTCCIIPKNASFVMLSL